MHTSKRISLLKRCCSLYSREYYKNYTEFMIHKSSIENVVKNFLYKLYGTKTLKTPLIIELSPIFRAYDISGKIDYIYRGIQVIVKVVHLDNNELSKLVEFDLLVNPNYTE